MLQTSPNMSIESIVIDLWSLYLFGASHWCTISE